MEGWLIKESRHFKSWRPRYTVLAGTTLSTYTEGSLVASERIHLDDEQVSCVALVRARRAHVFAIRTPERMFRFQCSSAEVRERWVATLTQLLTTLELLRVDTIEARLPSKGGEFDARIGYERLTLTAHADDGPKRTLTTVASADNCFLMSSVSSTPTSGGRTDLHSAPLPCLRFAPIAPCSGAMATSPPWLPLDVDSVERSWLDGLASPPSLPATATAAAPTPRIPIVADGTQIPLVAPVAIVARSPLSLPDDLFGEKKRESLPRVAAADRIAEGGPEPTMPEAPLPEGTSPLEAQHALTTKSAVEGSSPLDAQADAVFRRVVACEPVHDAPCSVM